MTGLGIAVAFVVAAGFGATVRFWAHAARPDAGTGVPTTTLAVNVAGSFLLGLASGLGAPTITIVGVAGLGAMTTFSTFAVELTLLWPDRPTTAARYAMAAVVGGTAAAWLGLRLAG